MLDSCPTPWKSLYQRALQEDDPEKLTHIVLELEDWIFQRGLELSDSTDDENERATLRQVASELLKMKTDKLGWPGI
jgi:hypothetical protein